jgi:hypothetical protein
MAHADGDVARQVAEAIEEPELRFTHLAAARQEAVALVVAVERL